METTTRPSGTTATFEEGMMHVGTSPVIHWIDGNAPGWPLQPLCHAGSAEAREARIGSTVTCGRCTVARRTH